MVRFSIKDPISIPQHVGQMICFQWWIFSYNRNDVLLMKIKLSTQRQHIYWCYKLIAGNILMLLEMETKPRVPTLGSIHYITYATLKQIWKGDLIDGSMLPSTLAAAKNLHQLGFDHFAYLAYSSFATIFFCH